MQTLYVRRGCKVTRDAARRASAARSRARRSPSGARYTRAKSTSWRARWTNPASVRPLARWARSSSISTMPVPGADGVDRDADLHAEAVGERQHVASACALSARCPEIGARGVQAAAAGGSPSARSRARARRRRRPASRSIATATSRFAARDRVGERAELRGGVAEIAVAEDEDRSAVRIGGLSAGLVGARLGVAERRARAARVTAAPLPIARAPRRRARRRRVRSRRWRRCEPSSATQTGASGNARASAASVAAMRSASLWAATTSDRGRARGSVGGAIYCPGLPLSLAERWRAACGGSND